VLWWGLLRRWERDGVANSHTFPPPSPATPVSSLERASHTCRLRAAATATFSLTIEPTHHGEASRPDSETMVQLEDDAAALAEALARR